MSVDVCKMVRTWLRSGPGTFMGHSVHAVFQRAWGASGLQISLGDLIDALHYEGFRPDQRGKQWVLVLPSGPS